ncbi:phospholipase A2 inhibitor-like [Copidosoma floridanum]|uniref:phospholipase A2 inhibitor-like n=1 Tax=Copidosoma floridanum TaxID=29053 RepID=UPI0006C98595|nr:phospholipase A2 inhibitor-like [Copidosoma floridanum]
MVSRFKLVVLSLGYLVHYTAAYDSLKTVDLSNRGLAREDFFIKLQHQIDMREVNELILRGNRFDSFIDCSTKLDSLRILDLSYNNLRKFFFLCQEEYNLVSLNVSHNEIEYINDEALSHRVINLKILDVSYNKLYVVNDTMLQHMKNLEVLSLASNPIEENIDSWVFQNLTQLKHLDLRNISSPYFSPMLFEPLTNLEHLDLSYNPIEDVPPLPSGLKVLYICGTNILHLGSFVMPQLRVLALENSLNLTSVLLNNFENLTHLEILSMRDSPKLAQLRLRPMSIGSPLLPQLRQLSLQGCALETLDADLLPLVERVAVLDFQNNPWKCDCHMKWLNAINMTIDLVYSFRCQTPARYRNRLLNNITDDELECKNSLKPSIGMMVPGTILYPILWVSLVILTVVLLVFSTLHYSRGCVTQLLIKIRHRGNDTISYTTVIETTNDTIRILPVADPQDAEILPNKYQQTGNEKTP